MIKPSVFLAGACLLLTQHAHAAPYDSGYPGAYKNYQGYDLIAAQRENLVGIWEKDFLREGMMENRDPLWTLTIEFQGDGRFVFHNITTEELRFTNQIGEQVTRPITQETTVKGTYQIDRDHLILNFDFPSESEIENLTLNFGYRQDTRQAIIKIWNQQGLLAMQGLGSARQFYFKKIQSDNYLTHYPSRHEPF